MAKGDLTIKQEKFCNKYLECGNASEAYRYAYNCSKMSDNAVWNAASILMDAPKVAQRIDYLKSHLAEAARVSALRIFREYEKIAFSSIASMHKTWVVKEDFDKLTADQKSCIKSITTKVLQKNIGTRDEPEIVDVEYVKVELYDKLAALAEMKKMLGFDTPTKIDVRSTGVADVQKVIFEGYDE